jgi:hypothetical protein
VRFRVDEDMGRADDEINQSSLRIWMLAAQGVP